MVDLRTQQHGVLQMSPDELCIHMAECRARRKRRTDNGERKESKRPTKAIARKLEDLTVEKLQELITLAKARKES